MFTEEDRDLLTSLSFRVAALEAENKQLRENLEATNNELAYIDAYTENLQVDIEGLELYVDDVAACLNDVEAIIFPDEDEE